MIRFGTFGHTYLDLGGPSMPAASSGDAVTFNIRSLADASRFGHLASGDCLYVLIEGEILKITTGGSGVLTWSGLRGQCGTAAVAHPDGVGVRETVPGQAFDTFIQDPSTAAGDLIYKAAMAAPAAPSLSTGAGGGTIAAGAYGVKLTKVDAHGNETLASTATSITTTGTTSTITIASPALDGIATGWNCYFTQPGGSTYTKQNSVPFVLGTPYTLTTPPTSGGAAPPSTSTAASAITALPVGTANQVLAVDATTGLPAWKTIAPSTTVQANSGGTALSGAVQITGTGPVTVSQSGQIISITSSAALNPMTAQDDLILGGSAGAETRLAAGTNGQVLTIVSGHVAWATPSPSTTIQATGGSPLSGAVQIVGAGSVTTAQSGQVVTVTGVGFANPMTTAGDVIIGGSAGAATRLAKGADNQVLTIDPATHLPVWSATGTTTTLQAESGGTPIAGAVQLHGSGPITISESGQVVTIASSAMTNPMTTAGDLILGGTSGAAGRLAKGADSQILTVDPTTHLPVWAAAPISGFGNPMTTAGDVIVGDTGGTAIRLAKGTDNQVLTIDPTSHLPLWRDSVAGFTNPMTLGGDLIYNPAVTDAALTNVGSAASSTFTTYVSSRAFDGDDTTNHYWTGFTQPWISVDLGSPKAIGSVRIHAVDNTVTIYNIQGSSDNSTWVNVVTGHTMSSSLDETYSFAAVATYRYWRFIGTTYGSGGGLFTFALYQQGSASRLPIGATGAVLTVSGGLPVWAAPTSGFTNPMTTAGDLILGGTAGAAGRLAKGADSTVLTMDPTTHLPVWAAPTGGSGTTVQGGASTKVQLEYTAPAGSNLSAGSITIANGSWTDIVNFGSFTVDDAASIVECFLNAGCLAVQSSAPEIVFQVLIDGVTGKAIGAPQYASPGGAWLTPNGSLNLGSLAAGTHTVKLQAQAQGGSGTTALFYLRQTSNAPQEYLHFQVVERKTTMNTSAAPTSGARLWRAASQTGIANGVSTQLTFDTVDFDTDSLKGSGSSPWSSLTITRAGKYLLNASVGIGQTSLSYGILQIRVNGNVVRDVEGQTAGTYWFADCDVVYDLKVGDVVTAWFQQTSGSTSSTYVGGGVPYTSLSAISLGGIVSGTAQNKELLDYSFTGTFGNYSSGTSIAATTYTDLFSDQSFVVGDANSVVTFEAAAGLHARMNSSGTHLMAVLLVDGTTRYPIGSAWIDSTSVYKNPFSGGRPIEVSGLSAGTHTARLQLYADSSTALVICDPATYPNGDFIKLKVIERKLVPASPSYANVNKVQLTYPTNADISVSSITASTYTNAGSSQSFTVDDPNSEVEIVFAGAYANAGSAGAATELLALIDGTTRYRLGVVQTQSSSSIGGSIPISGLAAGAHTLQLQVYTVSSGVTTSMRFSTQPQLEFLNLQVIERKVVNTGAGGTLDQVRAYTSGNTSIDTSNTETALTFDSNDTAYTTNASMHSTSSNTSRLVAQVAGRYHITGFLRFDATVSGIAQLRVRLNGSTEIATSKGGQVASTAATVSGDYYLNVGDYVELTYNRDSGAGTVTGGKASFSMYRTDGYAINPATTLNDMVRATTGGVPERVASTGVQGSIWSTDSSGKPGWNGLQTYEAFPAADVTTATANVYIDVCSLALPAGTYEVSARCMIYGPGAANGWSGIALLSGATLVDGSESYISTSGGGQVLIVDGQLVLASTTTVKLQLVSSTAGAVAKKTALVFTAPALTRLRATKVA